MKILSLLYFHCAVMVGITSAHLCSITTTESASSPPRRNEWMVNASVVPGVRSCGGQGKFVEMTMGSCKSTPPTIDIVRPFKLTYITSADIANIQINSTTKHDGIIESISALTLWGINTTKGVPNIYRSYVRFSEEDSGKIIREEITISNVDDGSVEVCIVANFKDGHGIIRNESSAEKFSQLMIIVMVLIIVSLILMYGFHKCCGKLHH